MSENTDREVVYRITSQIYHVPRWDGNPGCNTNNTDVSENELWTTAMESEMDDRLLCSKCGSMGSEGRTRRELIKNIRDHLPAVEDPTPSQLNAAELDMIETCLIDGGADE